MFREKKLLSHPEEEQKLKLIDKLQNYGYEKQGMEYTKSFITCKFIEPNSESDYPLSLKINLDKNKLDPNQYQTLDSMASAFISILTDGNTQKKPLAELISKENNLFIVKTNIKGIEYLEKVFEETDFHKLGSKEANYLRVLGYKVTIDQFSKRIVGDLSFGHIEYAPVENITPENKEYVPYRWKIRLNVGNLFLNLNSIQEECGKIVSNHGSPKYRNGERKYLERDPIVFRVNKGGLKEITAILKSDHSFISRPIGQ